VWDRSADGAVARTPSPGERPGRQSPGRQSPGRDPRRSLRAPAEAATPAARARAHAALVHVGNLVLLRIHEADAHAARTARAGGELDRAAAALLAAAAAPKAPPAAATPAGPEPAVADGAAVEADDAVGAACAAAACGDGAPARQSRQAARKAREAREAAGVDAPPARLLSAAAAAEGALPLAAAVVAAVDARLAEALLEGGLWNMA
jgi:hypothetical protein